MTPADSLIAVWQGVATDPALLDLADACDPTDVASVARLRKSYPAEHVAVALSLTQARRKAVSKFPDRAGRLIADAAGLEQATSWVAAKHKAQRFRNAGLTHVTDLCCGIGGDAMGLTEAGLEVTAIDRSPVRAWMASHNAGCRTRVEDVITSCSEHPADQAMHLDPARRTADGRVFRLSDYRPDPAAMLGLTRAFSHAAIKLSPAVDLDDLAQRLPLPNAEVEFISEAGRLVQAVLWTGRLASDHLRTATLLADGQTHTLSGRPGIPGETDLAPASQYLYTIDPSVERARLLCRVGLPAIHPKLGLLTADAVVDSPWLTGFELLAELPFATKNPKKLKHWLSDHDAGLVEIKTRGKAVDPDRWQRELRGKGETPYTLFILRFDQRLSCLVTRRIR